MNRLSILISISAILTGVINTAFSQTNMESAYVDGNKTGSHSIDHVSQALTSLNPESVFENYTRNPAQTQYYQGEAQTQSPLNNDAKSKTSNSEISTLIAESISKNKTYIIDSNTAEIKRLEDISQQGIQDTLFCVNNECGAAQKKPDEDFNSSVSELSAFNDASKQFDSVSIFKGKAQKCSDDAAGFRNCCRDSGWGLDTNLAHCSSEEKELGKYKQNSLTIYLGSYCSKKVLGVCLSHKKTYCTFPSKLARITQVQGRQGMLHIGFGSAKNPDCRGITPEELQRIDFSKIDYSEYYKDISEFGNDLNIEEIQKRVRQKINALNGET